ncbi:hypothetical protein G5S_0512 [Chlamydia pecorum E58]|uniref:Uncharacterized protein n=1 Tax=Chlamydia pecorum (strain ATCC VR-628 / DSM 29919 / E58) TaxID=331635 RepID=A0AA34RD34_CHLPE|nr:hypothetical protein G5S_0512 [Chlamydia pecorum E58]
MVGMYSLDSTLLLQAGKYRVCFSLLARPYFSNE